MAIADAIRDFKPDAVVLDLAMPGKSGWTAAREIRDEFGASSPILIALTGKFATPAEQAYLHGVNFDVYLLKPCDPKLVTRMVRLPRLNS